MKILDNYSLAAHNTFGIDARCRQFVEYATADELGETLAAVRGQPWMHIGSGSNLLFTTDYPGTVLHSAMRGCTELRREGETVWVRAESGLEWDALVAWCVERGYYGLENLSHIPGEVGAAAVQNVGAYGVEAGQRVELVEGIDASNGQPFSLTAAECGYAYRDSLFKHRRELVVTRVTLRLSLTFRPDLTYAALAAAVQAAGLEAQTITARELRALVVDVRRAKLPEVGQLGSAGSFFMNPVVTAEQAEALVRLYPDMPHYATHGGYKVPAAWLIEQCGWRGRREGCVGVYPRQALVLVNYGGATGADVVALSRAIQADVRERFGVELRPEVNFV